MARGAVVLFEDPSGRALVEKHCRKVGLDVADLERLLEELIDKDSLARRRGLWRFFDQFFDTIHSAGSSGDVSPQNRVT
jgi:hypothetical protein